METRRRTVPVSNSVVGIAVITLAVLGLIVGLHGIHSAAR